MTPTDPAIDALIDFYRETSAEFSSAQRLSGLACPSDCGACCKTSDVSATVFEMLPMALALHQNGRAEEIFDQIQTTPEGICPMFQGHATDPKKGRCGAYETRPLVCRIFAVARRTNKYRDSDLVLCKELKELYPDLAQSLLGHAHELPLVNLAYSKMTSLHPSAMERSLHIRQALGFALEKVLYHFYQK
ncbi:MAG: YkgJ family cysteine cluster protein [Bacteriovoracia bacterium]